MSGKLENRSISFDNDLFTAMEEFREKRFMSRSEFVQRAVLKYMQETENKAPSSEPEYRSSVPYARKRKK